MTAPVLDAVSVSTTKVVPQDRGTWTVKAHDDSGSLAAVTLNYQDALGAWRSIRISPEQLAQESTSQALPADWHIGEYALTTVSVEDAAGNRATYSRDGRVSNAPSGALGPSTHNVPLGAADLTIDDGSLGVPSAPTGLTVAKTGDQFVRLSWSPPEDTGGGDIIRYTVATPSGEISATTKDTFIDLRYGGLKNGRTYKFTVTASNLLHSGAPSTSVDAMPVGAHHFTGTAWLLVGSKQVRNMAALNVGNTLSVGDWKHCFPVECGDTAIQWSRISSDGKVTPIPGATGTKYLLTAADLGSRIQYVKTSVKLGWGTASAAAEPSPAVTAASMFLHQEAGITGGQQVGAKATVTPPRFRETPSGYAYQWYRVAPSGVRTPISGANASTYTPTASDLGAQLSADVVASKPGYISVTSHAASATKVAPGMLTVGHPSIAGSARVGSTLSASPGVWGPGSVTLRYQWERVLPSGAVVTIPGATGQKYVLSPSDVNTKIRVRVTGSRSGYATSATLAASTSATLKGQLTSSQPKMVGTARVGSTLTASPGKWGPGSVALTYQWSRVSATGRATPIPGATRSAYKITTLDRGKKLQVTVRGARSSYEPTSRSVTTPTAVAR